MTMSQYLAAFHTHLSALRSHRALQQANVAARLAPVPREISSSCGTCVRYESDSPCESLLDADLEAVFLVSDRQYRQLIVRE